MEWFINLDDVCKIFQSFIRIKNFPLENEYLILLIETILCSNNQDISQIIIENNRIISLDDIDAILYLQLESSLFTDLKWSILSI